jgi:pimeloyl-ACP methyl ester carboxylesterase
LAFARKYPARLRGLVLADTRAEGDDAQAKAGRDTMIAFAQKRSPLEVIDLLMPKMLAASTHPQNPAVVAEVRRLASQQTSPGIISALKVLRDRPDARPSLGDIKVPTLVIVGSEDALTPPTMAETLVAGIPGAQLATIPGAGHLSNLEQPESFNGALLSFLRGI